MEKVAKARIMIQQQEPEPIKKRIDLGKVKIGAALQLEDVNHLDLQATYLHNFLDPYESFINKLIIRLNDSVTSLVNPSSTTNDDIGNCFLEIIRDSSEADFVFVLCNDSQDNCFVKAQSNLGNDIEEDSYKNTLNSIIFPIISLESVFNPAYHGSYNIYEDKKGSSNVFVIIIPLKYPPEAEVMVVCGLPGDSYLLGDVYGRILSSFYQASQRLLLRPVLVEAAILDDLKRDYGFVSASLYNRRFHLFCDRLKEMVVYFEPILHLEPEYLFISGWEALARNPDSLSAPCDLFQAAELWGPRFTIELDQYFLTVATLSYHEARKKSKQNRPQDILPLSVNVYPESLMRTAYFETVRQIVKKDKVIPDRNLILEISEKSEIPKVQDSSRLESPLIVFKKRLLEYVQKLRIRFAIDDFGVGHASVSRLAGLHASYVKIDREILHHQHSDVIIRFVHELVGANNLNPSHVIVEGVDETIPISLYRLKEIGVSYIQGYLVGKPSPEIYRLTQDKADLLKKLILEKM